MISKRLWAALVIVYVLVQLLSTIAIVALQLDARAARAEANIQRNSLAQQNEAIFCVLEIQPSERTQELVDDCRDKNLK